MCKICETKPVYEFTNKRKVCKTCYMRWFEKKAFYIIKKFSMVKKGDILGYKKGKGFRDVVLEDVLGFYETKAPVRVVKGINKVDKIAVSLTIDQVAKEIINNLIKGNLKVLKMKPVEGKIICPLYLFLDKEVELYGNLKGLKFVKIKKKGLLEDLEKKHPEVKHAIVNSYLALTLPIK